MPLRATVVLFEGFLFGVISGDPFVQSSLVYPLGSDDKDQILLLCKKK